MQPLSAILFIVFLSTSASHAAGIQKWVDKDGRSHYGERPPSELKSDEIKGSISVVDPVPSSPAVVLYSTSRCGYCKKAKAFMDANKIRYREYDIEKTASARQRHKQMGGRGVPLLVMNGKTVQGFSERRYTKFFGL